MKPGGGVVVACRPVGRLPEQPAILEVFVVVPSGRLRYRTKNYRAIGEVSIGNRKSCHRYQPSRLLVQTGKRSQSWESFSETVRGGFSPVTAHRHGHQIAGEGIVRIDPCRRGRLECFCAMRRFVRRIIERDPVLRYIPLGNCACRIKYCPHATDSASALARRRLWYQCS